MFRHGEYSTETDRKPFIFTLFASFGSLIAAVLCFVLGHGDALSIFAGILLSIVAIAAFAVLLAMVTDRAYVEDGVLHMQYLLKKTAVPAEDIVKITYKDEVYTVVGEKGKVLGTINGKLTGIDSVLLELDRNHVSFE